MDRTAPCLIYLALIRGFSLDEAEDFALGAFIGLYTHMDTFIPSADQYPYLAKIVVNRCVDESRQKTSSQTTLLCDLKILDINGEIVPDPLELIPDSHPSPEEQVISAQETERLLALFEDPSERELIRLHSEGFSWKELADTLGLPPQRVKSHMHRSVVRVRDRASGAILSA